MMKKLLCSLLFTVFAVSFVQSQTYGDISGGSPLQMIPTTLAAPATNTPTPADGTDLGTIAIGSSTSQTYTFTNTAGGIYILGTTALSGDFSINSPDPGVNFGPAGTTSTFTVTFEPSLANAGVLQTATIEFLASDGVTPENYYFQIQGTGGAASPELVVTGDDGLPIGHFETTTPGDNTDFGQAVANSETVVRSFTLKNNGADTLNISAIELFPLTNAHYSVVLPPVITGFPFKLNPDISIDIQVQFTPTSVGAPLASFISIQSDFSIPNFLYQVSGEGIAASPTMEVYGNGNLILSGDDTPSTGDHTVFPSVDIADGGVTRTFTIENSGTADLVLTSLSPIVDITGADAADFTVTIDPATTINPPGGAVTSTTFTVTFDPTTTGVKDARIEIPNNAGADYIFDIQGTATDDTVNIGQQLLITQYYQGLNSNDNWLEIKNISATTTINSFYTLGVFLDDNATTSGATNITNRVPDFVEGIPALDPGEIILYRRNLSSSTPGSLGTTNIEESEVCSFTGNDVIVISVSSGTNTYLDRIDILGVVGSSTTDWGTNLSLVKGCGTDEIPAIAYDPGDPSTNINYNASQFIELTLDEVNAAVASTNPAASMNIALGTQVSGTTTWTGSWSNGIADKTREVIVDASYTNANGTLSACDLTINPGASVNLDSDGAGSNYVLVTRDLAINGSMTIGDTEALVMEVGSTVTGQITKIEKTTPLNNFRDYTYWSSPVSTTIEDVFVNVPGGGVDPNRIWEWTTPSSGDIGGFAIASGSMEEGRGYLAEAPISVLNLQQHQVEFVGTPHNGPAAIPVGVDATDGNGYGGYNIIGNPYPSAINIDDFLENQANNELNDGATTDATIWLWTHGTQIDGGTTGEFTAADYATYNLVGGVGSGNDEGTGVTPTNIIGSGQGFLIRVLTVNPGDGFVNFNNNMRVVGQNDTQFFKSAKAAPEKDRVWLNMTNEDGKSSSQILIGFMEKATDGFDRGYDGLQLGSGNITFYSNIENDIYAIQGLGAFNGSKEVSLGFYSGLENKHKISLGKAEGILVDEDIYLVDNELNIVHDLKQGAYEFVVTKAGNYKDRFTLQFNSGVLSTDDVVLNNSFIVFNENNTLNIKAGVEISKLKVYDVTGRLLIDSEPNSSSFEVPSQQSIKAGTVLILNATMKDGSVISKKAIKY